MSTIQPNTEHNPAQILEISARLIQEQVRFAKIPILSIVSHLSQTTACFLNHTSSVRQQAEKRLAESSGLSKSMVSFILDDLFSELTEPKLLALLQCELGEPVLLDRFSNKPGDTGQQRAYGPRLTVHILPSTILGVSLISLVTALLVKSANLVRINAIEQPLIQLFLETLKIHWPQMPEVIHLTTWDKTHSELTRAAFQKAEAVIAYGNDETIAKLKILIPPTCLTLFHGHKLSFGLIARESMTNALAEKVALDVSLFEQRGCLSPHLYYVEAGGKISPIDFAEQVAQALASQAVSWPSPKPDSHTSSQIQQLRGALPIKGGKLFSSEDLSWTVLYDPDPTFSASPLARTIWIKNIPDLSQVTQFISPIKKQIQAIGIALPDTRAEEIISAITPFGGCRICPIGNMQRPPLNWMHDGTFRLLPLLRFVKWEID